MKALLILSACIPMLAQRHAQVSGAVHDASTGALVNAGITVVNAETGVRRTARSDAAGHYVIASLPPGVYKITVRKEGFQTIARLNVALPAAQNTNIDFTMQVGSVRQVVTVNDSPSLRNTQDGSVGLQLDRDLIETLPLNGRGVLSLLDLAPGILATPATGGEPGQFSSNGQRPNTNYFTVDGVSANTSVSGGALPAQFAGGGLPSMTAFGSTQNLAAAEDLQEVRVRTSSFAPEFGRLPGAQVAIATRGGTNELHGSAFYAMRNRALDANNWFANQYGLGSPASRLNDWGASFGGPLQKDRTFFFASYEGLRLIQPFTDVVAVPSLASRAIAAPAIRSLLNSFPQPDGPDLGSGLAGFAGNVSRPAQLDTGSMRIDRSLSLRHTLFLRYNDAPSSTAFGFAAVDSSQFAFRSFTAGLTSILAGNSINDLRVNVSWAGNRSRWLPVSFGGAIQPDLSKLYPVGPPAGPDVLYGFGIANSGIILAGQSAPTRQGQWTVLDTIGVQRGSHAFRIGVDTDRLSPARDNASFTLAGESRTLAGLLSGAPLEVAESQSGPASSRILTTSLFAQDTWRVHPLFVLTYGVRWELTPPPSVTLNSLNSVSVMPFLGSLPPAGRIWPAHYAQIAPRAGAAYQISQRAVLRAGWGVFYDASFSVATDPINGIPFNRWQFTSAPPVLPAPLAPVAREYTYSPNLRLPRSYEWNAAYEYGISASDVASCSYVGSSGRELLRREGTIDAASNAQQIVATNHGVARYHGLELQYRRKWTRGLQALVSYNWSHSLDNGSSDSEIYLVRSGMPRDWASSSFDVRQSFNAAFSIALFQHWSLDGIVRARSGFPVNVLTSSNQLGFGFDNVVRPDLVAGTPIWIGRRLNPQAFAAPSGVQGNLGRNALHGFGNSQVDIALRRDFHVRNESVLQLRVEAFNLLNHAAFADPVPFLSSLYFGQSTSMLSSMLGAGSPNSGLTPAFQVGSPRTLQLSLRFRF